MGSSMKTPPKRSRSRRSSRNLMRIYDRQNDMAARHILARPCKSNQLLIDCARRHTARRAEEIREAGSRQ